MDKLKIVKGNTFKTILGVKAYTYDGEEITDFSLNNCTNIVVNAKVKGKTKPITSFQIVNDKNIQIQWNGKQQEVGSYTLEVCGKLDSRDWRFYDKTPIFDIVNTNAEANIPERSIISDDFYRILSQHLYIGSLPQIITIKGDKGDKGDTGPQGPKGDKGDKGDTGSQGGQGPVGKSAYLSYLDTTSDNPVLTEVQWLASLKGSDGQDGNDGITPHIDSTTGNWFIGDTATTTHAQGPAGQDGQNGQDGVTPTISINSISGGHNVAFNYGAGDNRNVDFDVMDGSITNQVLADWDQSDSTATDYIKNKPAIPAALVRSNWNESDTSSMAYILNKPTIPASPVQSDWNESDNQSLAYIANKPNIPAAQVRSNWNESDSSSMAYILNKPSIPTTVSQLTNDSGYLTSSDLSTYAKIWSGTQAQYTALSPDYDSNTIYIITAAS